jgi:hypothetical protein
MLRAYPHEPSVDAGGTLQLHVATDAPRFHVVLARWGKRAEGVLVAGPFRGRNAPPGAPGSPWDWPAISIELPRRLAPGAYVARFFPDEGAGARGAPRDGTPDARWGAALFVVRAPSVARVLLNLPLFTYHAYNVAHVDGTLGMDEGACLYSGSRSVTLRRPGGGTGGHPWDEVNADVYERETPRQTFAHWDLHALAWFVDQGLALDVCTDLDLHRGTVDLERYALLCTFGHDEYWTREKRGNVERWIEAGGAAAFFGANTCWFRVIYDEDNACITRDGSWSDVEPEDTLTGLSFRAGGGKWIGPRPPTGYRIERSSHSILRDARLEDGVVVGAKAALIGYEVDGIDLRHAPRDLDVLGRATLDHWDVSDGSGTIPPGGHAAMVAFALGRGTVFNAGTTDWARALAWGDDDVGAITRSVVRRMGRVGTG